MHKKNTPFQVMAKPIGPICNLDCTYCYYLSKEALTDKGPSWQISKQRLEAYIHQYIQAHPGSDVYFAWQGGEPTLLGVDFFQKVVELQKKHRPPDKRVHNTLQTNATLLNDEWGHFFRRHQFLIGISIDGPRELHDGYRVTKQQKSTFDKVMAGIRCLQKNRVEHNFLIVVNRQNARKPLEVYRFLRDELNARFIQFIPCVEPRDFQTTAPQHWSQNRIVKLGEADATPAGPDSLVTEWSVDPDDYGTFLCAVFDEWLRRDVGNVFVQLFDIALSQWMGLGSALCVFRETCGDALAIEHDGKVYSCDHYVYPEFELGSIDNAPLADLARSARQEAFGQYKSKSLPQYCLNCDVRFACNGECPKNRFIYTPEGEPGLNYLCSGLKSFFHHIDPWMKRMKAEIDAGRTAADAAPLTRKRRMRGKRSR